MVDSISNNKNGIQDLGVTQLGSQQVEQVNRETARETASLSSLKSVDNATISPEAMQAYEQEKEILKFSRLAMRVQDSYDAAKVSRFKDLLDSGRINDYLRNLNTDLLSDSILNSPSGAFLR
jgi:hypothetical protein